MSRDNGPKLRQRNVAHDAIDALEIGPVEQIETFRRELPAPPVFGAERKSPAKAQIRGHEVRTTANQIAPKPRGWPYFFHFLITWR